MKHDELKELLIRYGCGPVKFTGTDDALFERRLVLDHVIDPKEAGPREQFEALAGAIRDVLAQRWLKTAQSYDRANPKQVYYLSMEFLIGRSLANNVTNLLLAPAAAAYEKAKGVAYRLLKGAPTAVGGFLDLGSELFIQRECDSYAHTKILEKERAGVKRRGWVSYFSDCGPRCSAMD